MSPPLAQQKLQRWIDTVHDHTRKRARPQKFLLPPALAIAMGLTNNAVELRQDARLWHFNGHVWIAIGSVSDMALGKKPEEPKPDATVIVTVIRPWKFNGKMWLPPG